MTHDASAFFAPWEIELGSYLEVREFIDKAEARWSRQGRVFAWRGCVNASWSFHSALFRRLWWTHPTTVPDEATLYKRESRLLQDSQRWGLHSGERGRLSVLEQLATLQHYGAPTRLLDVTFNPLVAVWFAVERSQEYDDADGRLFVVDVTNRLIDTHDDYRGWSSAVVHRPWDESSKYGAPSRQEWSSSVWAWRPSRFLGRIANQHGGFLFGGVPSAATAPGAKQFRIPREPDSRSGLWPIEEVRKNTSLALRFHKVEARAGGVSDDRQAAFTVRIKSAAKKEIRGILRTRYELDHPTIYGDYPGFALHGTPDLEKEPWP